MKRLTALLLLATVAACTGSGGPSALTAAAPAIQASLTADAARLAPTDTPEPIGASTSPPSTPIPNTPPPLDAELCAHDLLFLSDLTVPDGTVFRPGEAFDKRWKVQNTGQCAWGPDFRIVLVGGDGLGSPTALALYPALPGAEGVVRALMVAPQAAGDYAGTWSAQDPQGNQFGNKMWVRITVATPGG